MEIFDQNKLISYSDETIKLFDRLKNEDLDKFVQKEEKLLNQKFEKKKVEEIKNLRAQEEIEIQEVKSKYSKLISDAEKNI